jgi:hypothetical protein
MSRTKLCPNCVQYVGDQEEICKHCGYRFDVGNVPATGTWGDAAAAGTGAVTASGGEAGAPVTIQWQNPDAGEAGMQTINVSQQMQGAQKVGKWIAIGVALVVLAGVAIPIVAVTRGVGSAADRFSDFEVPGVSIPTIEFTPPTLSTNEGTGSFASCRSTAMEWLRELLANDGSGSRSLSDLFIEASEDVGAASDDYWVIVQAFSGSQGVAIQKGTKAGLREAKVLVAEGCREAYP